jgi:hypothetical protein
MPKVIEAEEAVTTLLPLSSTVTAGWVVHAEPLAPPPGWVENTSLLALPVILKVLLVALSEPLVAITLSPLPVVFQVQPEKVAVPFTVATALVQPLRVPEPVALLNVTVAAVVTVLPNASSTVTTGWIGNAVVVEVAPSGWVVNTSLVAVPKAFTVWVGLSEPEKAEWFVSPP